MHSKSEQESCEHHEHMQPRFGCEQTLDELSFDKSAFACALYGDLDGLRALVDAAIKRQRHTTPSEYLNERDRTGYTCLHYAARNRHYDVCAYLVECGCDVNAATKSCLSTPLHRACYAGSGEIVELLLASKADATRQDCDGKTPLHKCVERFVQAPTLSPSSQSFKETIRILLKHDSNLTHLKDNTGKSPLDICPNLLELIK